ncbi:hypothetical protein FZEAL_7110 [Fusarium zealandicum]|uniref:Uncharacterized protein n=1 Tax=Fusarium zealandicum TaxID=1053134 RepID=A0A8H4UGH5_9HYPO|nr:hypothetical protein FZEAL_7110 [Fusarium zealandicum]
MLLRLLSSQLKKTGNMAFAVGYAAIATVALAKIGLLPEEYPWVKAHVAEHLQSTNTMKANSGKDIQQVNAYAPSFSGFMSKISCIKPLSALVVASLIKSCRNPSGQSIRSLEEHDVFSFVNHAVRPIEKFRKQ